MADSYIMNVKPELDRSSARNMENDLNRRFSNVAKKFQGALKGTGSVLKGVFAGVAVTAGGVATGIIGKIISSAINLLKTDLNTLNEPMNNALKIADQLSTRAGQYNVSTAKYLQAQGIAESTGMSSATFENMLSRFSVELEKSRRGESDTLKQFVNEGDTIDAFYSALESIKALPKEKQNYMVSKIFGQRNTNEMAEMLQTDFRQRRIELYGKGKLSTPSEQIDKLAEAQNYQDILAVRRRYDDLIAKSSMINKGTVQLQDEYYRQRDYNENIRFFNYADYAKMAIAQEQLNNSLDELSRSIVPAVTSIATDTAKFVNKVVKGGGSGDYGFFQISKHKE